MVFEPVSRIGHGEDGDEYDAGMAGLSDEAALERLVLSGGPLRIDEVVAVARGRVPVELSDEGRKRMSAAREVVERAVAEGRRVYGVSTGFGLLANTPIAPTDLRELQRRIVVSHATGSGDPLDGEVVRAMQLLRARTLAQGYSGVRPVVVEALLALLTAGVMPLIPEHGSVGASGDLAQLAHLALPLIGEGEVEVDGERMPASEGLRRAGIEPLDLSYKEGLSLVNGTEGMLALACLAVTDAVALASMADVACAMSVEGLLGTDRPFQRRLHELRPHPGQLDSARNLRELLAGSPILASHRHSDHAIQDAYSLRCAPQVHGACRDVLVFARQVAERELGSVTDNPVVFGDSGDVVSVGNFHGEPLAFVLDFLAIALTELADISERRVDRLLDPALNHDLPPFLARDPGLNSGLMLTQYTAAALVSECKVLAHPASVDSIPTSGNQEDHVSMGWTAGLKLRRVLANVRRTIAIEVLCAAQAIDLRAPLRPGAGVAAVLERVRREVPPLEEDRFLAPDMAAVEALVAGGELVAAAERAVGPLR
jgi:histidine ammonia-lyase